MKFLVLKLLVKYYYLIFLKYSSIFALVTDKICKPLK